jgi:hypothetical protein
MQGCCRDGVRAVSGLPPSDVSQRMPRLHIAGTAQGAIAVAIMATIPKCPACLAGYVLLYTSLGLSLQAAAVLRWLLIGASSLMLAYVLLCAAQRAFAATPN